MADPSRKVSAPPPGCSTRPKARPRGFATTVARYFAGSKAEYMAQQRALANQAVMEALTDLKLDQELACGKQVVCVEIAGADDYKPQHWRERVGSRMDIGPNW